MRVGIDFGTSYSSAAYLRYGRPMAVKPMKGQSPLVPSIVTVSPQGELQVGHGAAHARADRSISEFKQYLGDDEWPLLLAGRELRPAELITRLLAFLRDATPTEDGPPDAAVLTVPASYGPHRRDLMRLAGKAAGFADVDILEEPIAGAHYYAREGALQAADGDLLVVYDLGGGTFDIALVQAARGSYETIGYAGLPDCGGIDFDTCLYEDIKRRCQRSRELLDADADTDNAGHDTWLAALQMRLAVRQFCRDFKQLLSELEEHDGMVPNVFPPEEYRLTRGEFEKMIAPLIDETVELSEGLVRDAELGWKQISAVLMVGGSCRIPYIRRRLEQLNPHVLQVDELDLAVAYGAAIYGQRLDKQPGMSEEGKDNSGGGPMTGMPPIPGQDRQPPHDRGKSTSPPAPQPVSFGLQMKRRNPVAAWIGLPLITLGIYHLVWYYKIHNEMAKFDRRQAVPTIGPVLVLLFLCWTVIAPLRSYYNAGNRIRNAQRAAGLAATCSGTAGMLLMLVLGVGALYYQAELNKIADQYMPATPGTQVPLVV